MRDLPDPVPQRNQVLVRVAACGVCGRDCRTRRGPTGKGVALPLVLGHEIAGYVAGLGSEATGFALGDVVCSTQRAYVCGRCTLCRTGRETLCPQLSFLGHHVPGGYAEHVLVSDDNLVKLPQSIDVYSGAIVACTIATAYNAICDVGRICSGERVLVVGAGGLAIHAVQIARASGAHVLATTRTPAKATALLEAGANDVIVASDGQFSAKLHQIFREGADAAIDTVGGAVFEQTRRSMALGGRIVLLGEVTGTLVTIDLTTIYRRGLDIRSTVSASRAHLERALDLVTSGLVRPRVHDVLPLSAARTAHELLERSDVIGRIVLSP